jgi:hypothetical protein
MMRACWTTYEDEMRIVAWLHGGHGVRWGSTLFCWSGSNYHVKTPDEDFSVDDKTIRHDLASKLNFFPTNGRHVTLPSSTITALRYIVVDFLAGLKFSAKQTPSLLKAGFLGWLFLPLNDQS